MLENFFLIDTRMRKFDTTAPATPLIGSLSKAQFCTGLGHPISKPIWTDLSDWDIFWIALVGYVEIFFIIIVDLRKNGLCID
ncbi:hypothetical protein PR202_gb10211 [Eleusine coracana subsp. coracana]|uniref:Domain X domain-containing protein n=1 Tax=Eleusine coracana subsp. coracana TaxID=191504 RepID=A0AAV5EJC5_ELECO|nr:hypothetical protein PR202_gb10211 [Eleusine coracana subsp. coracana]